MKVSIIVPVYNVSHYLDLCLNSLCKQTLEDIEIILVDDGSTDDSGIKCDNYAKRDSRIRVIHKNNQGAGLSRNCGLEIATGEYIGFVDSDDCVSPEMFQILYSNAVKEDADISYCKWLKFSYDNEIREINCNRENVLTVYNGTEEIKNYLLNRVGLSSKSRQDVSYGASVWCGIFRKNLFDENNIKFVSEREFISEDMIFNLDIIPLAKRIVHSSEELYFYRYNPKSLTTVYKSDRFIKNVHLYYEMERRLDRLYYKKDYENSLRRYFIAFSRYAVMQEVRFIKQNGRHKAKNNIKSICQNKDFKLVLNSYPWKQLPFKYRIFCFCQKHCLVNLLILICKLKG